MDQDKNNQVYFGFSILTNPPFTQLENKKKTNDQSEEASTVQDFIAINLNIGSTEVDQSWIRVDYSLKKPVIMPIYSAFCQTSQLTFETLLITGGVVYDGSQDVQRPEDAIPQTTNFCFQVRSNAKDSLVVSAFKLGEVVEVDGEEVQETVQVINPMIYARHNHKLFAVPNPNKENEYYFYAIGGQTFDHVYQPDEQGEQQMVFRQQYLNLCEVLDSQTNTWQEIPPMHNARASFSGFVQANRIYVFGGFGGNSVDYLEKSSIEYFDIAQQKWNQVQYKWKLGLSAQLMSATCVPIDKNRVLIFGGAFKDAGPLNQISYLDLSKSNPTFEPLPNKLKMQKERVGAQYYFYQDPDGKNMIFLFGGNPQSISIEVYELKYNNDQIELKLVHEADVVDCFKSKIIKSYNFVGMTKYYAWIHSIQSLPIFRLTNINKHIFVEQLQK